MKTLSAALAVALAAVALAGCDRSAEGTGSTDLVANSLLTKIVERGEINIAHCLTFAPFGFLDDAGNPAGYDVEIGKMIAEDLGVELNAFDTTSANRIPNLQTGKADIVVCNFTVTPERAMQIAFTHPYVAAGEVLLVKKDSGINGVEDLSGKTVSVVKGSTNADIIKEMNPEAIVQEYDDSAAMLLAVQQGQADATIEDQNFLAYQAKLDPSLTITKDSLVTVEYNAIGVPQGDPVWLEWLDEWVLRFNRSGANAALYEEWFGVPPQNLMNPSY